MKTFNKKYPLAYGHLHVAVKSISLLIVILILQACSGGYVTSYKPLTKVETNDFCHTEKNKAVQPLTKSEQQALEDEHRASDETTIALMLKKAAYEIVSQAESTEECGRIFQQGTAMFNDRIQQIRNNFADKKSFKPAKNLQVFEVQKQITDFWREDQSARGSLVGLPETDPKKAGYWANRLATAHTI